MEHGQPVVERSVWQSARDALLAEEKVLTQAADRLAALRRRLPWRPVPDRHRFVTAAGETDLSGLFDGRRQLVVYHHMLTPGDAHPCSGCSMVIDQIPHLSHLQARDTTFAVTSAAPLAEIDAFKARMGWTLPWVEGTEAFNLDCGMGMRGPGFSVFLRADDRVFLTYTCTGREIERVTTVWGLLDMTPMGRQESWQDAPDWVPQGAPYAWWRLHDEYRETEDASCA